METAKRERRREEDENGKHEALSELPSLPLEIIREILLRLPAKSVGRFRCVSKLFLSLLSDAGFARTHLDLVLRNDAIRSGHRRLILSSHNLYAVEFDSIGGRAEGNKELAALELNYPLKDKPNFFSELMKEHVKGKFLYCGRSEDEDEYPVMVHFDSQNSLYQRNWVDIVGSCNGLVCISPAEGAVFLFNPTTGESKRIPDVPEMLRSRSEEEEFEAYGFGFDALSDDYKVIKLVSGDVLNASVYSLRKDAWRRIGDLGYDYGDSFYTSGVLLDGAIHWVVGLQEGQDQKRVVTAFDLSRETFWDMPLPDEAEDCSHRFRDFVVGILNGCLCIVNSCHEMHDDIWVMHEYGVAKSWTRIRIGISYRSMKPICSAKNEVLLELDGDLVLYNVENDTSRNLVVRGVQLSDWFEADTYIESLISPNSYGRAETRLN